MRKNKKEKKTILFLFYFLVYNILLITLCTFLTSHYYFLLICSMYLLYQLVVFLIFPHAFPLLAELTFLFLVKISQRILIKYNYVFSFLEMFFNYSELCLDNYLTFIIILLFSKCNKKSVIVIKKSKFVEYWLFFPFLCIINRLFNYNFLYFLVYIIFFII